MATVAEIFGEVPSQILDRVVSDEHIPLIAKDMLNWEPCASVLGLSQAEQEEIRKNHPNDYLLQKQASLFKWRQMQGFSAKYRILFITFCSLGMSDLAEKLKRLLLCLPDQSASKQDILENFRLYLQECYASFGHPSHTQWPFSDLQSYVDLSFHDVPLTDEIPDERSSTIENEKQLLKPIELENLFLAGNRQAKPRRKVVLLEGVAGSGKTTMSWHSCKEWAAGKLFQHIRLLIHVSLNDPAFHSATCLADIIPHPSKKMRAAVAEAIAEKRGKGVCFLFDACDEAPAALWQGFLYRFIEGKGRSMIPCCSIVMTARPEIHLKVALPQLLTARVITSGFESSKLEEFLESSVGGDQALKSDISASLELNPELVGLCSLPLNAVILIHLYRSLRGNLPSTRTGLFKPLVYNLLIRHIHSTQNQLMPIEEFSDLPEGIRTKFNAVCALAFSAFMEQRRLIGKDMLKAHNLSSSADAMGLMQLHQQLAAYGPSRYYSFLHLSLQEFLAAVHVTQMNEDEQATTVQRIIKTNPLSPVLPFYAGLTKLSNRAALDVLLEVTKEPLDQYSIMANMCKNPTLSGDRRRSFLALLNCIYESQESRLCELVDPAATKLNVCLEGLRLHPVEFLSVGLFLSNTKSFKSLFLGIVSNIGLEVLIKHLRVQRQLTPVALHISLICVNSKTPKLLKELVQCVLMLGLKLLPGNQTNVLKNITEGIYQCSTPRGLSLVNYYPSQLYYLVLLLSGQKIFQLYVCGMTFNSIMAQAVKVSTLNVLGLFDCEIDDDDLKHLVDALQDHNYLVTIAMTLSPHALTFLLNQLIGRNSVLEALDVYTETNSILNEEQEAILNKINRERLHFSRPTLKVTLIPKSVFKDTGREVIRSMSAISQVNPELMYRV